MRLLNLQVSSSSAKIMADKLTHEFISDVYQGFNPDGYLNDNNTDKKNIVIVENVQNGIVTIAAYDDQKIQRWGIETNTPVALARRLVQNLGLMCETGIHDSLFG